MQCASIVPAGCYYIILYIDRQTTFRLAFIIRNKSCGPETLALVDEFLRTVPTKVAIQFGTGTVLHADNAYDCKPWRQALAKLGIALECCSPHTPEGNGFPERQWQTIFDGVRAMLYHFNSNLNLWALAVLHKVFLLNRVPVNNESNVTPFELLTGHTVDQEFMLSLPAFGTPAYVRVPTHRQKLDPKARTGGIFVGVETRSHSFKIFFEDTKTIIASQAVQFDTNAPPNADPLPPGLRTLLPFFDDFIDPSDSIPMCCGDITPDKDTNTANASGALDQPPPSTADATPPTLPASVQVAPVQPPTDTGAPAAPSTVSNVPALMDDDDLIDGHMRFLSSSSPPSSVPGGLTRHELQKIDKSRRQAHNQSYASITSSTAEPSAQRHPMYPLNKFRYYVALLTEFDPVDLTIPTTFKSAMSPTNIKLWEPAIKKERDKCTANNTFGYVTDSQVLHNAHLLQCRWIFKLDSVTYVPKARLIVLGNHQISGTDFDTNKTFSPVAATGVIRMLIAYANANGWHIYHGDVSSAFLHAKVPADKPPIYVRVPEGFPSYMDDNGLPSYISTRTRIFAYRLWKSLYGLVEAPRWWYEHIHALLISYGFIQSPTDPCLYNRDLGTPKAIQLGLIVDDFLIIAITVATIMSFQEQLSRDVKLSQFEKVSVFLGIRVRDDKHCVSLDQQQYITQLLEKCKMADCKGAPTPATLDELGPCPEGEELEISLKQYVQFVVGAAMHVYVGTKPELGYALQSLCRHVARPGPAHLQAAKHLLRYLQQSKSVALVYRRPSNPVLLNRIFMFSDANFGGTHTDRRPMGGGGCYFHGALIFWTCKRLPVICLSSAESEYTEASLIAALTLYARNLACDMHIAQLEATIFFEDNQPAMKIATNPVSSARVRHIDIKYHFIREQVQRGNIQLVYLPTSEMLADIFTKALGPILFVRFRDLITGNAPFEHELFKARDTTTGDRFKVVSLLVFGINSS